MTKMPEMLAMPYRQMRADALTAWVMQIIVPYLDERDPERGHYARRDCSRALIDAFRASGVDIISDADRAKAGLLPRNEYGVTAQEVAILEAHHIEAMLRPLQHTILVPESAPSLAPTQARGASTS